MEMNRLCKDHKGAFVCMDAGYTGPAIVTLSLGGEVDRYV